MRVQNIYLFLPICIILNSCATIFNSKKVSIEIKKDKNVQVLSIEKQLSKIDNNYVVYRTLDSLKINLAVDSNRFSLAVPSQKAFTYWENILNLGIGFLIDKKTVKKYTYPKNIYIERIGDSYIASKYPTLRKGTFEFDFAFPYINFLLIKTDKAYRSSAGFMGFGIGLNLAYRDKNYLSLNVGISADFPIPFPAPIDYKNGYQKSSIAYLTFRNHFREGRFDVGYGLSFSHSYYSAWIINDTLDEFPKSENIGFGLSFSGKYNFWKVFTLGFIYQPSFIGIYPSNYGFQQFLTLELAFKIRSVSRKSSKKNPELQKQSGL